MALRPLPACSLCVLTAGSLCAQYRPLSVPAELRFEHPTPAFAPGHPDRVLGEFQPGITVRTLDKDPGPPLWRVAFERFGAPDIECLVAAPDQSLKTPGFSRIEPVIAGFPLLQRLLETPDPWPDDLKALAVIAFGDEVAPVTASGTEEAPTTLVAEKPEALAAWGFQPLKVLVRRTDPDRPAIVVEFWNKGEAYRARLNPSRARQELRDQFREIQAVFRPSVDDPLEDTGTAAISAIHRNEEIFLLPNDLRVGLKYLHREYLIIEIQSVSKLRELRPGHYDPPTFGETLLARVSTNESGFRFIRDIPMIDQGKKGYCAVATLARVLNHYGYPVDEHDLARLAETEAQLGASSGGGTLRDDMIDAMRRVCSGIPFRLDQLKDATPEAILATIESGTPIIWFNPGHARLLIGIHPDSNQIVYSDSYGIGYEFTVADWDYFTRANVEMWLLKPMDLR